MSNIVAKCIVESNELFVDAHMWPLLMISIVLPGYALPCIIFVDCSVCRSIVMKTCTMYNINLQMLMTTQSTHG